MTGQALRFGFGRNWQRYSRLLDETRVTGAQRSLSCMLDKESLDGLSFLDIGAGSGLFSLAARRLGARVHSFDFDPESVQCVGNLRRGFGENTDYWKIERGSVLDDGYMEALGGFDVVYAWGVLHHTGAMWRALRNAAAATARGGVLYVALYNDQGGLTLYWSSVKRLYNHSAAVRWTLTGIYAPYFVGLRWLVRRVARKGAAARGMSLWYDMKDWLGGYPFEVANPGDVLAFMKPRGFRLEKIVTCGGRHGCNEYLFVRDGGG